jgi:hypothetical protein
LSLESTKLVTDAVIAGALPAALFRVFGLGRCGLRAEVIDSPLRKSAAAPGSSARTA